MTYTSSQAAKLLRRLNDEHLALVHKESQSCEFIAAMGEDVESVRPEYDYAEMQKKILAYEEKIRTVKHAINVFNATHTVPDFDITIDQMLVYIPQLTRRKEKLSNMRSRLPKARLSGNLRSNVIDYLYANYDIAQVEADYAKVSEELSKAQTALDLLNNTETMEIDI